MVLRELVQKSLYVVDERAAAEAIVARARARWSVPEIRFTSAAWRGADTYSTEAKKRWL